MNMTSNILFLSLVFIANNRAGELTIAERESKREKEAQLLDAVAQGDCQKARSILRNYTIKGSGLLCMAILKKQTEMVELLVGQNSNVNAMFDNLWPLQVAVETENENVVEILVRSGANVNAIDGYGSTVLHFLPDSGSGICNRLIQAGAHPTVANSMGLTPLHNAAIKGFTSIVTELSSCKGVAIDAKDCDGRTPLHYALLYSHENVALKLIDLGAKVNIESKLYERPLDIADDNGLEKAKKALMQKGAYSRQLPYGNIYDNDILQQSLIIGRIKH
jgi:ankyrin repeat protein